MRHKMFINESFELLYRIEALIAVLYLIRVITLYYPIPLLQYIECMWLYLLSGEN